MADNTEQLLQEKKELNALINKGIEFEVKDVAFKKVRILGGLFHRKEKYNITRKFRIAEPTLATLDRLSAEWIDFALDDERLKGDDTMTQAKALVARNARRCAKIIAIAVLGEDRLIAKPGKNCTQFVEDTARIEELTDLFARTIKPSQLYQLYVMINAICNLGDFINSIRLMSTERTTMPIRIEENNAE